MQKAMLRLDSFVRRRRRWILAFWVIVLLVAFPFAARQSDDLSGGGFEVPGSSSAAVQSAIESEFPGVPRTTLAGVVVPQKGATDAQVRAAIERMRAAARKVAEIEPADPAPQPNGSKPVIVPMTTTASDDTSTDIASDMRTELDIVEGPANGVSLHMIGQGALWAGMQDLSKEDLEKAETGGFPIVLLILLAVFGSLAAALLPVALGVFSVVITGAAIYLVSQVMDMSVFVTNMASMIGIGVAVDYSLFVLARYREEVCENGLEPERARGVAMATSGLAVLFSGLTVIVSLAGLYLIDNQALRSMALGAILVVAIAMAGSATLLPALIKVLGHRAYARGRVFTLMGLVRRTWSRRRPGSTRPGAPNVGFWRAWTDRIMRRPVLYATISALILLTLAVPALDLKTGAGALRQFPEDYETRLGFEAAASVSRPGESSPVRVLVRGDRSAAQAVASKMATERGIAEVLETRPNGRGDAYLITAITKEDPESPASREAIDRLRGTLPGAVDRGESVAIGGITAAQDDVADLIAGSLWKIMLFVLGLSYLVLLVLLRSVVLPLKAVIMNLLSVGASYGVLVAVFQWGWLDGFAGFESRGHIDTLTPPLVLAVVFGLSMDYEVFLLSRIRERYDAVGDTKRAVAEGLAKSARTITSAALIMTAVFAVFVLTGVPSIKQIGLGTAFAIAIDATLVRLVLVPSAMELMGRWNWYLPKWLDRLLPDTRFEELGGAATPGTDAGSATAPAATPVGAGVR